MQYIKDGTPIKQFINTLLNNEDFIIRLMEKISEVVENKNVRLLATDLTATLDVEELEKMLDKEGYKSIWRIEDNDEKPEEDI